MLFLKLWRSLSLYIYIYGYWRDVKNIWNKKCCLRSGYFKCSIYNWVSKYYYTDNVDDGMKESWKTGNRPLIYNAINIVSYYIIVTLFYVEREPLVWKTEMTSFFKGFLSFLIWEDMTSLPANLFLFFIHHPRKERLERDWL